LEVFFLFFLIDSVLFINLSFLSFSLLSCSTASFSSSGAFLYARVNFLISFLKLLHFFCRLDGPEGWVFCFTSFTPNLSFPILYMILGSISAFFSWGACITFKISVTSSLNLLHSLLFPLGHFTSAFLSSSPFVASSLLSFCFSFRSLTFFDAGDLSFCVFWHFFSAPCLLLVTFFFTSLQIHSVSSTLSEFTICQVGLILPSRSSFIIISLAPTLSKSFCLKFRGLLLATLSAYWQTNTPQS